MAGGWQTGPTRGKSFLVDDAAMNARGLEIARAPSNRPTRSLRRSLASAKAELGVWTAQNHVAETRAPFDCTFSSGRYPHPAKAQIKHGGTGGADSSSSLGVQGRLLFRPSPTFFSIIGARLPRHAALPRSHRKENSCHPARPTVPCCTYNTMYTIEATSGCESQDAHARAIRHVPHPMP